MFVYCVLLSQIVLIIGQDNLKQGSSGEPFDLSCSDGSFISSISSTYTDKSNDHRLYQIKCSPFKFKHELPTCRELPETDFTTSFSSGCTENEYVFSLESTEFKNQDRKFRVTCCAISGLTVSDACHETLTAATAGFRVNGLNGQIVTKISSQYVIGKRDGKFIADRSFGFTLCNFTEQNSKPPKGSLDSVQQDNSGNSAARSIASFNQRKSAKDKTDRKSVENGQILESVAFQPFDLKCPKGEAIKSINVKKVDKDSLSDAVIGLKCSPLPDNIDISDTDDQLLGYIAQTDGSVQSPCATKNGQFLCGLKGIYDQNRQVEAHCCQIRNAFPSLNQKAKTVIANKNGNVLQSDPSKEEYIGNLDQLADGTFVAQMIVFGKTYTIKGKNILTSEGCRCKCECECPKVRRKRNEIFSIIVQNTNDAVQRMKRQNNCSGDCNCKCVIPDC